VPRRNCSRALQAQARYYVPKARRSPTHSDSGFALDTLRALAQEGSLPYSTCPGAAVAVGAVDAGTVDRAQEERRGAQVEAGHVAHGKVPADMHPGAASRNHA
jgi:hypothetical protein